MGAEMVVVRRRMLEMLRLRLAQDLEISEFAALKLRMDECLTLRALQERCYSEPARCQFAKLANVQTCSTHQCVFLAIVCNAMSARSSSEIDGGRPV